VKVLVCDDRENTDIPSFLDEAIASRTPPLDFAHDLLVGVNLKDEIVKLFNGVRALLEGDDIDLLPTKFDTANVILLDYGLTTLEGFPVRLTGDMIAGYIRAFSDAAYVVALNKNPSVDFDLKYLLGDFDTRADLAVRTNHLAEPGLWDGRNEGDGSFCPWYWPSLCRSPGRRGEQIKLVEANLNASILAALGFPDQVPSHLSRQAIAFLSPLADDEGGGADTKPVTDVTFWNHFQNSNRTLPDSDRDLLAKKFGASLKEGEAPEHPVLQKIVARVVAGELDFWFRRDILGPQRLLIDAPHLQAWLRFPAEAAADDPAAWNQTATASEPPFGLSAEVVGVLPAEAIFAEQPWTDRPAFWFPLIEEDEGLEALLEAVDRRSDLVFCEDIRRFAHRSEATRFVTELTKGIDVRYVKKLDLQYSPASQFAL
jgi:hypothetical protein